MARLCLSVSLRRTERLITRHYDRHLRETGITAIQLPILATIASEAEPTLRLLTAQLELDRSTLSRNLTLLRRRGLIELTPSSGPKAGLLSLTRKGREVLRRAHRRWQTAHRELLDALGSPTVTDGMQFLRRLRATVRTVKNSRPASPSGRRAPQ